MMAPHPKRILIVEDNKIDLRLLRDVLVVHGYETLQTDDGLDAINLALANRPDLILMDIRLPHLSGLEVTRRLRDDDRSKEIPIIAVTALAMEWHEREALNSGCDAYLSKPITILRLLDAIEPFLFCPLVLYRAGPPAHFLSIAEPVSKGDMHSRRGIRKPDTHSPDRRGIHSPTVGSPDIRRMGSRNRCPVGVEV